jgi:uncharacterized protein (TIGR03083 family)
MYVQDFAVVEEHAARFAVLLRSLSGEDVTRAVPGMAWTVDEVAKHVLSVLRRYTVDRRRASSATALSLLNAEDIAELNLDIDQIATEIVQQVRVIARFAATVDSDARFPFHAGVLISPDAAWANLISEFFVHGDDIAQATGKHFKVPDRELEGIWRALLPAATGWLRPHARTIDETYALNFPFGEVCVHLVDGEVITDEDREADRPIVCSSASEATLAFYRRRLVTNPNLALLITRFYDI